MYYEVPQPPPPTEFGKDIWKVFRFQIGIFAIYQLGLAFLCRLSGTSGFMIFDMFPLIIHWLVLLVLGIIAFTNRKPGRGLGYIISLLVTGIVGFGSCFYISGMIDPHFFI